MNALSLSQKQILEGYTECQSLGQLFKKLEDELFARGHVVCQFRVNGMNLTEEDEKRLSTAPLDEVQSLEVGFQAPNSLIGGALDSWCRDLPFLVQHTDEMAAQFRFSSVEGNLRDFVQLIDECQMLVDSLIAMDSLLAHNSVVSSEQWKKTEAGMAHAIGEALQAFQKKDFTQLADILEYDIGHSLQTWLELLTAVKANLNVASDTGRNENLTDSSLGGASSK